MANLRNMKSFFLGSEVQKCISLDVSFKFLLNSKKTISTAHAHVHVCVYANTHLLDRVSIHICKLNSCASDGFKRSHASNFAEFGFSEKRWDMHYINNIYSLLTSIETPETAKKRTSDSSLGI